MMADDLIGTPFREGARIPGVEIDCLGVVLEMARRRAIDLPDPWQSVAAEWRRTRSIGSGFPVGWRRLTNEVLMDDDVVLMSGQGVGYVLDGYVWTASPNVGCCAIQLHRASDRIEEAWRGPCSR